MKILKREVKTLFDFPIFLKKEKDLFFSKKSFHANLKKNII